MASNNIKQDAFVEGLEQASQMYANEHLNMRDKDLSDSKYTRNTKMRMQLFDGYDIAEAYTDGGIWVAKQIYSAIKFMIENNSKI